MSSTAALLHAGRPTSAHRLVPSSALGNNTRALRRSLSAPQRRSSTVAFGTTSATTPRSHSMKDRARPLQGSGNAENVVDEHQTDERVCMNAPSRLPTLQAVRDRFPAQHLSSWPLMPWSVPWRELLGELERNKDEQDSGDGG